MYNELRLLTLRNVPSNGGRVFRVATLSLALAVLFVGALVAACIWIGWRGGIALGRRDGIPAFIAWWIVICFLPYWLIVLHDWRKARRPDAWLATADKEGVYVKWRSYQNAHWPADDVQVVFIAYGLIGAAREHKRRLLTPEDRGGIRAEGHSYVELRLMPLTDTAPLAQALANERASRPGGKEKKKSTWRHFPVSVEPGNVVRIEWRARPGTRAFLDVLQQHGVAIDAARAGTLDLTREADDAHLQELARSGDRMALIRVLRH